MKFKSDAQRKAVMSKYDGEKPSISSSSIQAIKQRRLEQQKQDPQYESKKATREQLDAIEEGKTSYFRKPYKDVKIVGKRWFERTNGNTYHTAEVYVDGKYVGKSDITYGYDEQYVETANKLLVEKGYTQKFPNSNTPSGMGSNAMGFVYERRNNRDKFRITVDDVDRKKDL